MIIYSRKLVMFQKPQCLVALRFIYLISSCFIWWSHSVCSYTQMSAAKKFFVISWLTADWLYFIKLTANGFNIVKLLYFFRFSNLWMLSWSTYWTIHHSTGWWDLLPLRLLRNQQAIWPWIRQKTETDRADQSGSKISAYCRWTVCLKK